LVNNVFVRVLADNLRFSIRLSLYIPRAVLANRMLNLYKGWYVVNDGRYVDKQLLNAKSVIMFSTQSGKYYIYSRNIIFCK